MQINVLYIYVCGDVVGGMQLVYVVIYEGIIVVLYVMGKDSKVNMWVVFCCIYIFLEMVVVGLMEIQVREKYGDVKIGECLFFVNGKVLIKYQYGGKMKIIVELEFGEIVGVLMIGFDVMELIGQVVMLMNGEMMVDMLEYFIIVYLIFLEMFQEVFLNVIGFVVYFVQLGYFFLGLRRGIFC